MHEFGIASEIVRAAIEEARRHGAGRVSGVTVRVGVLRGIVPESLHLFFGHASKGTVAENAILEIEQETASVECEACGATPVTQFSLSCPRCGGGPVRVRGGDSLSMVSVELDD